MMKRFLVLLLALFIVLLPACSRDGDYYHPPATPPSPQPSPPSAPSSLTAEAVSYNQVELHWFDNSHDEDGFKLYRDSKLVATLPVNTTAYQDIGLKAGTNYRYTVKAYNEAEESEACSWTVRTPNPPITVRLDRIGVYDNGEHWLRGKEGEVYVYVVVSDGKKTTEAMRFPRQEGQHYKLEKNETVDIGAIIFSVDEVGHSLTITVVGYESDGSEFELLVYKALGALIELQIAGGAGGLLEAFDFSLGGLIAQFAGTEDDWLGSYENAWDSDNNWGIGRYTDIACEEEDGTLGLRLWFTIKSQ